ncbi:MAG: 3-isopropylmalate dehydratase large subunit, partial [Acidiferrobacterales bacterium]
MSMTLAEKVITRAAGKDKVRPGEIVTCQVDLAMMHDSSGPRRIKPKLEELGVGVWDPSKVVIITDHFVTESDKESVAIQTLTRDWVRANGIRQFHEAEGICHIVLPERGYLRPGMFIVGGDSHSTTAGVFGCFMVGIGATEMAGVLATGEIWIRVPSTILVQGRGRLRDGVAAKDLILMLCRLIGISGANYKVVEYAGTAVELLPIEERLVLTNMSAELGAKTGIIAPDTVTVEALAKAGVEASDVVAWRSDAGASYDRVIEFDADDLVPQVAAPHSPENSAPVDEHAGTSVDQAYIGACTGAKLQDLKMAARILRGRNVANGVSLFVAPASVRIAQQARADGTLATLEEVGAVILPSGCGACIGLGPAALGENKVGISTTSRNFRGRMGAPTSETYLASPYTVAATAITGRITDP